MATRIDYWLSENGESYPTEEEALLEDKIYRIVVDISENFKYEADDWDDLSGIIRDILEKYDIIEKSDSNT